MVNCAYDAFITEYGITWSITFSFLRSTTYKSLNLEVTVKYTQGSWIGSLGTDVVRMPKGINGTSIINIATIFQSENFFLKGVQWQGILGLAYSTLAKVNYISYSSGFLYEN